MFAVTNPSNDLRKAVLAVAAALVLHLFLFVTVAVYLDANRFEPPKPPEQEKPIEMVMMPPPEAVSKPEMPKFMDVPDHAPDAEPTKNPAFESDRTTRAAAEIPATGAAPLPSQNATEQAFMDMQAREYTPGKIEPRPASPASPPASASRAEPQKPIKQETATPPPPDPTPLPRTTPDPEALALLAPRPTPRPTPVATPTPLKNTPKPPEPAKPRTADSSALPPSRPTYQPHSEPTRIQGSIDNRGKSSVDAISTPLGRYRKNISDAIGSRWHYYTKTRMDLIRIGTARVKFYINEDGKIENLRLLHNTSNEVGGTCSVQSILEAEIPPIPPDIASTLEGRRLEIEYTFTIY